MRLSASRFLASASGSVWRYFWVVVIWACPMRSIERIRARPLLFAALRQETRRSHLNVAPHEVWYLLHEELQVVEVVALVHDRQDPSLLATRLT